MLKKLLLIIYCAVSAPMLFGMQAPNPVKEMLQACVAGDVPTARRLLDNGVDVNTVLNGSPFSRGELLVDYRFDQTTFLHWAAKEGHTELARLLIKRGANKEARSNCTSTPLDYAMKTESPVFDVLLEARADIQELAGGLRPLSMAALCLQPRMVKRLLECGINARLKDEHGGNGLLMLGMRLTNTLYYKDNLYKEYFPQETEARALAIIEMLRHHGVTPHCHDRCDGTTPFHCFAKRNNKRLICSLMVPLTHSAKRKEARKRFFALRWACTQVGLPKEVAYRMFSFLPVDCKYSGLEELVVPLEERTALRHAAFLDEAWPLLPTLVSPEEAKALRHTLSMGTNNGDAAFELATDPEIKKMLDPETWKPKVEMKHA